MENTSEEEFSKFEEVLILRPEEILNKLNLKDIKMLRLTSKLSARICSKYIYEDRGIQLKISQRNQDIFWKSGGTEYKLKVPSLAIKWMYAYDQILIFPKQFLNITKLLLHLSVGADFETFDIIFRQLPNLNYFGFSNTIHTISLPCWDTVDCYPSLDTIEIDSTTIFNRKLNVGSLCRFIAKHPNIHTVRTSITLLSNLYSQLRDNLMTIENLYVYGENEFSHMNADPIDVIFKRLFDKNIYKNLFFQFYSISPRADAYYLHSQNIPGIKGIHSFKLNVSDEDRVSEIPFIKPENVHLVKVVYDKSEWFNFY